MIRKVGKNYVVSDGREFVKADDAIDAQNVIDAAIETERIALEAAAEARKGAAFTAVATYRGQFEVRLSDVHDGGQYPVMSLTGRQFEGIIANLDKIKAAFEVGKSKGLIVDGWRSMKPAIKDRDSKPKPVALS